MTDQESFDGEQQAEETSRLARVMAATGGALRADFDAIRAAFEHGTLKGDGGEQLVAKLLRSRLPDRIGVTAGQVLDSDGRMSRQVDVVLYDSLRTPMLFESPGGGSHLVPAEGVLAVVEVKTRLRSGQLESCLENCRSVKQLTRSAYFNQPVTRTYRVYSKEWPDLPIYYSVFAGSSDKMYAGLLNDLQHGSPLEERIDTVCYLDRGVNLNAAMESMLSSPTFTATASEGSALVDVDNQNGLLLWYGALASFVMQADVRPINITAYMASELTATGTMPRGPSSDAIRDRLVAELAENQGLDPAVLRRAFLEKNPTLRDTYEILRAPGHQLREDVSSELRSALEAAKSTARSMSFEEWVASGIPATLLSPSPDDRSTE